MLQLDEESRARSREAALRRTLTRELQDLLEHVNGKLESYEKLQFLAVAREEWDTANDFLTPTLKIRREVIESAYALYLDDWYALQQKVIWH